MKLLSKIVAACFALILTISMAIPAQAEIVKDKKYTITVTGKPADGGAIVDVYKIINVKFDYENQQPINPTYVWEEPVAEWLKEQDDFKQYVGNENSDSSSNEVSESFSKLEGADLSELMRAIKAEIVKENNGIKLKKVASLTMRAQKPTVVFEDMDMGQYLILTTPDPKGEHSTYEYAPATANIVPVYEERTVEVDGKEEKVKQWFADDAKVTIKGSPAEIEKEVDDHTVAVGQKVNYTVNVPVPYYPEDAVAKLFRIGDYLPLGITFKDTYDDNQLKVYAVYEDGTDTLIGTSEEKVEEFELHYYSKDNGHDGIIGGGTTENSEYADFILSFEYDKLINKYGKNGTLKFIKVTYQGIINENAILRPGDPGYPAGKDPLENKAYVGQDNDPYSKEHYKPSEDTEKVYTYAINVSKVSGDGHTPLAGACFKLFTDEKGENPVKFVKLKEDEKDEEGNTITFGKYCKAKEDEPGIEELEVSNEKNSVGKLALEGLATGTYYLKETKAPEGYEVKDEMIKIEIVDEDEDGKIPAPRAGDVEADNVATNVVYETVVNRKPPIMPITGGMGTVIFSVVGIVLVVGGVTLIASYLRRKRA